ncbi:Uu.00g068480.m01.CDS01 [Anthostomella pinea]|uniref:Uu.00g068480.m01.CDS01 n=1 Tax=Anthostomella pinea TaxID=933095 RepID=A0AAI8YNG0_9PEZI|nr:Uu.00g068480.m01.CDS01 [Anthostomella pinea]
MADERTYKFNITMSCGGCSGAVNRVLGKLEGVKSYDVSLDKQEALVVTEPGLDYETVLQTIAKTGKKVNKGEEITSGGAAPSAPAEL